MPSVTASRSCAAVAYWIPSALSVIAGLHAGLPLVILIRRPKNGRSLREILRRRRRQRRPFDAGRIPRIGGRAVALEDRIEEIEERQRVADREDACSGRRQHMPDLEFG